MNKFFGDFDSRLLKINFTTEEVSYIYLVNGCFDDIPGKISLEEYKESVLDTIHPDDLDEILKIWELKTSCGKYEEHFMISYRQKDENNNWKKVSSLVVFYNEDANKIALFFAYKNNDNTNILNSFSYGYNNMQHFYQSVENRLKYDKREYCLAAINITHFKLFNKWYGRNKGHELLAEISSVLKEVELNYGALTAYAGSYNFLALLPKDREVINGLERELFEVCIEHGKAAVFSPAIGVYLIEDINIDVEEMHEYAMEALAFTEGNFSKRICYYDKVMSKEEEQEVDFLTDVRSSLNRDEFTIHIQPKVRMKTGKIVGGEALVRWRHPEKRFIYPNEFIPILERTGYICTVDQHVWELVCKTIRAWIDKGIEPVPISINVSRIDILSCDVVRMLNYLINQYKIEKKYLKIEITESSYIEDAKIIRNTIEKLHMEGFTLFMDDFGSGYSSLNMLKELSIDIIKLDMNFLNFDNVDYKRGIGILKSVINLVNEISIPIVMEGVETKEQVDYLQGMGVRFAQGYYFYKPMPIEDFEQLLKNPDKVDYDGIYGKSIDVEVMDKAINKLLEKRNERYYEVHISKTRGGFIEYFDKDGNNLIRVSPSIPAMYGCQSTEEFMEYVGNSFDGMVHPDDRERVNMEIRTQLISSEWNMDYIEYRIVRKDGEIRYINDYGYLTKSDETGEPFFYVFLLDVTDTKK